MNLTLWTRIHAAVMLAAGVTSWLIVKPWPILVASLGSITLLTLGYWRRWTPKGSFGPANGITAFRFLLTGLGAGAAGILPASWWFAALWVVALILDGVDGALARRRGLASAYGAALDVESDALLIGCLGMSLYVQGLLDGWVLLPGALRYIYVLAEAVSPAWPEIHRTRWARHLFVWSALALITPYVVPQALAVPVAALGGVALTASFTRSFVWLATGR